MSFQTQGTDITLLAGADLSSSQFRAVTVNSSGRVVAATAGQHAIGVLQNNPTSGQAATIRVGGVSKFAAGAAITLQNGGRLVASDATGRAVAATAATVNTSDAGAAADAVAGSNVLGIALEAAGAAGVVIAVLLTHSGAVPTTVA